LGVEGEDEEMAGLTISGIQNDFQDEALENTGGVRVSSGDEYIAG
jgi:hypothetical protein